MLVLSNAVGARLDDAEATGTIENTDRLPAALMARFGRASAEHVMEQVADRMGKRREPGFRARFAGQEFQQGREREIGAHAALRSPARNGGAPVPDRLTPGRWQQPTQHGGRTSGNPRRHVPGAITTESAACCRAQSSS